MMRGYRDNERKLKREVQIGYKDKLFTMRSVKQWNRLPRAVVQSPHLEDFKTQLDEVLSNLV